MGFKVKSAMRPKSDVFIFQILVVKLLGLSLNIDTFQLQNSYTRY